MNAHTKFRILFCKIKLSLIRGIFVQMFLFNYEFELELKVN
jgi:hypothetical protein